MQKVIFKDLGSMEYQQAWDYQEALLQENVRVKTEARQRAEAYAMAATNEVTGGGEATGGGVSDEANGGASAGDAGGRDTTHYLLMVEHPPVYTLGKSGHIEHVLIDEEHMKEQGIQFFRTNRGGDITFHGPGQLVGYPILDLEKFRTDIGWYLRSLEEVVIAVLSGYGIRGERSAGETGVWIEPGVKGRERKICAIGVRCSRWVTMHGFALNVNTDLGYFGNIVPCGIQDKQVTSLQKELGRPVPIEDVKTAWKGAFEKVFGVELV